DPILPNPFEDHVDKRQLEGRKYQVSEEGPVDGYVKISRCQFTQGFENNGDEVVRPTDTVRLTLSAFPDRWFADLNPIDRTFFSFYIGAWCAGRTVLKKTNCWLQDIAQMAHKDDCVKHSLLALAGTYVFDYLPDMEHKLAAQVHYKKAVILLSLLLGNARQHTPSTRDAEALVAAIALLNMNDAVSEEHWRERKLTPRWLEGARLACRVLDMTNPGHHYRDPLNVQPSDARVGNAVIAGRATILALPMARLNIENTKDGQFAWLLQGSELSTQRIHGGCGMSPSLLHLFSQITHVAAFIHDDPIEYESTAMPLAYKLLDDLKKLCQWYEYEKADGDTRNISIDVHSIRDLLASGHLDAHGAINSGEGMTASTAEAWRFAAIIYLQCRLLRLPRTHPEVLLQASNLAATIRVMPTSGYMFTAQAPFFPVFLLGIVAIEDEHSQCASQWFEAVTQTKCRSSVPPAFAALKEIRQWMAAELTDASLPIPISVSDRYPWWEDVVDHVNEAIGMLCLV
ncbi:uncharacterized protein CTRU02_204613, partial [Colletotrichum truncatum]